MRTAPALRFLPAVLLAAACQTQAPAPAAFGDAERDAIRQMTADFTAAINAKDWVKATSNFTQDAMFLPPNQAVVTGPAAIQQWMAAYPPFSNFTAQSVEIEGSGDVAYSRGTYELDVTLPGATAATHETGKYIEIWRKQADGTWKVTRDIFSSDLPVAPMPAK